MTRLTFAQVSKQFTEMGYELCKENKGYSCEVSNKFVNLQLALDWLNEQVSVADVEPFTGDEEIEVRAKDWQNGDYDTQYDVEDTDNQSKEIMIEDDKGKVIGIIKSENYLEDDRTVRFEEVKETIARYGYELHRNVGQFFTESKAPYVYFKSGEQDYAIHVTYFLDTIVESVQEVVAHKINMVRFQQVALELSYTNDQAGENLTGSETLSDRLSMLEKRLITAVEQRRVNVRQICSQIGLMVRAWLSGVGFGKQLENGLLKINRRVNRRAKNFLKMLTESVLPKYRIEHF